MLHPQSRTRPRNKSGKDFIATPYTGETALAQGLLEPAGSDRDRTPGRRESREAIGNAGLNCKADLVFCVVSLVEKDAMTAKLAIEWSEDCQQEQPLAFLRRTPQLRVRFEPGRGRRLRLIGVGAVQVLRRRGRGESDWELAAGVSVL